MSVSREEGSRFVSVQSNVTGRDLASFVEDVQERVAAEVALPPGYRVDYGGQFENLEAATARLSLVVPLALVLIFVLLFQTFGSMRLAAIIYLCVPLSVVGGVGMLYLLGLPVWSTAPPSAPGSPHRHHHPLNQLPQRVGEGEQRGREREKGGARGNLME